jgi:hypothetical protein
VFSRAEHRVGQYLRAVITFSRTVMSAKSRMFWNVRAAPSLVISNGFFLSIRAPSNSISPSVGQYTPVSTLNTVVLPAPLGPIRPYRL